MEGKPGVFKPKTYRWKWQAGQSRTRDLWNVKRREISEQGRLGKGALVANSKGPWGVSWAVSSLGTAEGP